MTNVFHIKSRVNCNSHAAMIFRSQFTTLYKLKVLSSGIFATVYDANVTSGDELSTVDMVVQQRDGPRWPRKHDDDDDI